MRPCDGVLCSGPVRSALVYQTLVWWTRALSAGFVRWHSSEVQGRAALGASEGAPDLLDDRCGLGPELLGGEAEGDDLVLAHPAATGERVLVVFRGQVPFTGVD